jgi:hypothetical protein
MAKVSKRTFTQAVVRVVAAALSLSARFGH